MMSQDTPSGSKQDVKRGPVVSSSQTSLNMQRLPASSPGSGGSQGPDRGPGWSCGLVWGVGQGRCISQRRGRGQSRGEGQGQGNRHDQVVWAVDQIQGEQNRGQMHQPSAQPPNSFQGTNQTPHPWRGPTVIHRHRMTTHQALRLSATRVSQTAMGNTEGVRKGGEGAAGVERKGRERGRLRAGRRYGCGRGIVPSKSVVEISSTTALFRNSVDEFTENWVSECRGYSSKGDRGEINEEEYIARSGRNARNKANSQGSTTLFRNSAKEFTENWIPDEDEFCGRSSKGDHGEISGEGCVSSRIDARNESDSQSFQTPKLCNDQSIVNRDTSERVFLNLTSGSCISDEPEQDQEEKSEEICRSEGIIYESIDLPSVRGPAQRVACRDSSTFGASKGVRDGIRSRGMVQLIEQGCDAAQLRSDDVTTEVLDGSDARNLASKCSRNQIAGSEVVASLGYADLYRKTRAIQSKGCGESRNRRQCAGSLLANNPMLGFGRGRCYFGAQEEMDTPQRILAVLVKSQNVLDGQARQSRSAQSENWEEEWKFINEAQQLRDNDQARCQSDGMKSSEDKKEWKEISDDTVVDGDLAISNSRPVFEVDQNLVVEYLVTHHNGSCTLFDVRKNSGIFPCILDAEKVLRFLGCCDFIRVLIDPSNLNNSVVKVHMEKLRLCVENCSQTNNCQHIHLCREFLMDCCFLWICSDGHDLESEHNRKIMVDCGIERFSAEQKLSLIRCSNLLVCREYNGLKGCPLPSSCFKIHVCNSYIMNNCLSSANRCLKGHILFNERNMKILRLYEVDQLKVEFLLRIIVGFHNDPVERESGYGEYVKVGQRTKPAKDSSSSYSGRGQVSAWKAGEQKVIDASNNTGQHAKNYNSKITSSMYNSARKAVLEKSSGVVKKPCVPASAECKETRKDELSRGEQQKNRCESFEEHTCCRMEICIERHRSETPYLWRVQLHNEWLNLENNDLIEDEFSNPEAEKFWGSTSDTTVCIDFSSLKSEVGLIQRLSTPSYVVCRDKVDATRWLWYWLDATGKWILYGENDQPPYQDVLEAKFLNDSRHVCCFETNGCKYELDFAKMEQRNLQTNFCRPIRRRPSLCRNGEAMEMPNIEYHYDESKLPLDWVPMDTESKHGMELVPLSPDDAAYETIKDGFFSTLSTTHFEINRIYRLQNLKLWQSFQTKTEIMENETGSQAEEVLVYHGTPEEETVRWICSLGFDQRMHGKHGSRYGAGVYFARTAKFSHCYTQPSGKGLRYMFCARVLVGRTVKGQLEYKRPPPIDPKKPTEGLFDTCVDNVTDPSIYVVFDNHQSYPEYLIEYRDVPAVPNAEASGTDRWQPTYAYSPYLASTSYPARTSVVSSRARAQPAYQIGRPSSSSTLPPSLNSPSLNASSSVSRNQSSARPIPVTRDISVITSALQADASALANASIPMHHAAASVAPDEVNLHVPDDSLSHAPTSDDKSYSCHIM